MPGAFLDTTLVVGLADPGQQLGSGVSDFVNKHQPSEMPYYALRELQVGRLQILCKAHNALLSATNAGEAMLGILGTSTAAGRTREAKLRAIATAVAQVYTANPGGNRQDVKAEALDALALQAATLWSNSQRLKGVSVVQDLACFNSGKISFGAAGELQGPQNSFNCRAAERCSAAAHLHERATVLEKMSEALKPENLPPELAKKNENLQRRKAIKNLQQRGPAGFDKRLCRALGDAYFVAMCPPGHAVGTTNLSDFEFLCAAVGGRAIRP